MTPPTTFDSLLHRVRAEALDVFGGFHPDPTDRVPEGTGTLLLLGPHEPSFWARITASPEWSDGRPDPVDRWSCRVIGQLAAELGATPLFPFTGPPWHPFFTWATRTGRAWASPVHLLVHDRAGLMVSYRGALALAGDLALPPGPDASPCATCAHQPCRTACRATALTAESYDVAGCHAYLDTAPGQDCLTQGCAVRRACPVSRSYGRLAAQSAYHMRRFHP